MTGNELWIIRGRQAFTVWKSPISPTPKRTKVASSLGRALVLLSSIVGKWFTNLQFPEN